MTTQQMTGMVKELLNMRAQSMIFLKINEGIETEKVKEHQNIVMNVDYLLGGQDQ